MARYKGNLRIEGSLGPMTMYQLNGQWVVRQRYGPDAKTMEANENYAPQRNHGREFGGVSRASKLLRDGFRGLIAELADTEMHSRMTKTLNAVKNLDTTSPNGERTVAKGLQTAEGRAMLRGWNGNPYRPVPVNLVKKAHIALETGMLTLGLADVTDGEKPMELTVVWLVVDFEKGIFKAEPAEPVVLLPGETAVWQRPASLEAAVGVAFLVVGSREMLRFGNGWEKSGDRRKKGLVVA